MALPEYIQHPFYIDLYVFKANMIPESEGLDIFGAFYAFPRLRVSFGKVKKRTHHLDHHLA